MSTSFILGSESLDVGDIDTLCEPLRGRLDAESRLFVHAADHVALVAALHLGCELALQLVAIPSTWKVDSTAAAAERLGGGVGLDFDAIRRALVLRPLHGALVTPAVPGIVIFTTGTTGTPKAVCHSWAAVSAGAAFVPERLHGLTWYLPYEPAGYAALQVYFSVRGSEGRLVVPPVRAGFGSHPQDIANHRVEVISATPTWWRMLVAAWPASLPFPSLKQATLGGEVVDQRIIDLVDQRFHPAGLTHIYASSEVGTAIVVSDRKAGFPIEYLGADRKVKLRITDGELEVNSPTEMQGYIGPASTCSEDGWFATGDLVEIRDARCFFVGRRDQRLNIGGAKVSPEEVESVLAEAEGVADCVVYGRPSPIVGTLLAADLVAAPGESIDLGALQRELSARLASYKVPRYMRLVDSIGIGASGKKQRA